MNSFVEICVYAVYVGTVEKRALTQAKSPQFQLKARMKHQKPSTPTEVREAREMEQMQDLMKSRVEANAHNCSIVTQEVGEILPVRSTKPLTEPVDFQFSQSQRPRTANLEEDRNVKKTKLDVRNLRKGGITEVKEFKFKSDSRLKNNDVNQEEFVSFTGAANQILLRGSVDTETSAHTFPHTLSLSVRLFYVDKLNNIYMYVFMCLIAIGV